MNFVWSEANLLSHNKVKVTISRQANVMLLDRQNFTNYKNGRRFQYFGGYYKRSPVILVPPRPGHWYIVIDLGKYSGTINYSINVI